MKCVEERVKRLISMPARYWKVVDKRLNGLLVCSQGDALIALIDEFKKISPTSVDIEPAPTITPTDKPRTSKKKQKKESESTESPPKDICNICKHPKEQHNPNVGCLDNTTGKLCDCKQFKEAM